MYLTRSSETSRLCCQYNCFHESTSKSYVSKTEHTIEAVPCQVHSWVHYSSPWQHLGELSSAEGPQAEPGEVTWTYSILGMQILESFQITRNSHGQTVHDSAVQVALVHVLKRSRGRGLTIVYRLIVAAGITHESETAAAYARMIHSYHANT